MNHIILIGNVGKDPAARGQERNIASFSLAVDERRKGGEKTTQWFNCVAFGRTGESIISNVTKGSTVAITGKLKTNTWEKDGVKQQDVDVIVNTWEFVTSKPKNNAIGNQGAPTWHPDSDKWG